MKVGNCSGLDCRKKDNSGSQKSVLDKLSMYKKQNPNTRCIWVIVNPKPNCKKLKEKIEKIQGLELFNLIFGSKRSLRVIDFVKDLMIKH